MSTKDELFAQITIYLAKGRLADAERALDGYLKSYANDGLAWSFIGYIYGCMSQASELKKSLQKAEEYAVDDAIIWFNIGIAYLRIKDFNKADDAFKKAQKLDKELKDRIKESKKEGYPKPIIPTPAEMKDQVEAAAAEIDSGPKLWAKPPVDMEVDVIQGMFRTYRGVVTNYKLQNKGGWFLGDVMINLDNEIVRMRYGPARENKVPEPGTSVIVEFEDGIIPRINDISTDTSRKTSQLVYVPVPRDPWDARWPKVCCACGEYGQTPLSKNVSKWSQRIKIERPKDMEFARGSFSLGLKEVLIAAQLAINLVSPIMTPIDTGPGFPGVPKAGESTPMISGVDLSFE
ncbi:MAG: tetratricopeptide repeat protein, partial [Candidatus Thorarchaeota archaeon]